MIKSWEQLEDLAVDLIQEDNPTKPKNSGGTKGEEDVIGSNIIVQCKFTGNKNLSILKKDLDRLCNNANLLLKFPIFLNSNETDTVISIPIRKDDEELIRDIFRIIILHQNLNTAIDLVSTINSVSILERFEKQCNKLVTLFRKLHDNITDKRGKLIKQLHFKRNDLTICDLFEGEKNGVK